MSNKIAVGIYLPCGVNVAPQPIFVEDDKSIHDAIGGYYDVVTTNCESKDMLFLGYVNDDAIRLHLDYNYLATNMFRRELYGDCVVLWGLNENGECDGENHTIPDALFETLSQALEESTATAYNMSVGMAQACQFAEANDLVDKDLLEVCVNLMSRMSLGEKIESCQLAVALGFMINMLNDISDFVSDESEEGLVALGSFCDMMARHFMDALDDMVDDDDGK